MSGIDLNQPILYKHASMRYFEANESHVTRLCKDDVLLLVFEGVLRFSEDGREYEMGPGEYHIQRHNSIQAGSLVSDMPKYLYVHFYGQWTDTGAALPAHGTYEYPRLKPLMERLDRLAHGDFTVTEQTAVFLELLARLYRTETRDTPAGQMASFMAEHLQESVSLDRLCEEFHFSKNHIINLFKQTYGATPTEYLNALRLQKAKHLLEATSDALEAIAARLRLSQLFPLLPPLPPGDRHIPNQMAGTKTPGTVIYTAGHRGQSSVPLKHFGRCKRIAQNCRFVQ